MGKFEINSKGRKSHCPLIGNRRTYDKSFVVANCNALAVKASPFSFVSLSPGSVTQERNDWK